MARKIQKTLTHTEMFINYLTQVIYNVKNISGTQDKASLKFIESVLDGVSKNEYSNNVVSLMIANTRGHAHSYLAASCVIELGILKDSDFSCGVFHLCKALNLAIYGVNFHEYEHVAA